MIRRHEHKRAEWCLREAIRLEPNMPRLRARLGTVLAATQRPQRALQFFLRDLRDDPGNVDTLLDYGELLLELGRLPEASEKFRRVLELEPANVDAHHRLGRIALAARRYEQATLEFELVLKLDPEYPHIRLDVAESLLRRERRREARRQLQFELDRLRSVAEAPDGDEEGEEATNALPHTQAAYYRRFGELLLEAGRPRSAALVFRSAVALVGNDADLYRSLALSCFRAGDLEGGVAASRRVVRLDPDCIRSIHNLALAALDRGQLQVAGGWIGRGMASDRHDVGIRRLRMRLWFALLRRSLARLVGLAAR